MSLSDIADLQRGRNELAYHSGEPPTKPPWLDMDKFNRGRQFFREYIYCCFLAMFTSLVCGLSVNNLLVALVFTHASDDPKKAFLRYRRTFQHVILWHYEDVWDSQSAAYKSIIDVRNIHNKVATAMNSGKETNVPNFSQYDMALTQCGFMGSIVMYPEAFGTTVSEDELEDYVHFWRGVGFLLGIDDEYNLCSGGYASAKTKCEAIQDYVLLPALKNPPKDFNKMVEALIGGSNILWRFRMFSPESVIAFGLDNMKQPYPKLGVTDTVRFYFLKGLSWLLRNFRPVRKLLNLSIEKGAGCSNGTIRM